MERSCHLGLPVPVISQRGLCLETVGTVSTDFGVIFACLAALWAVSMLLAVATALWAGTTEKRSDAREVLILLCRLCVSKRVDRGIGESRHGIEQGPG